MERRGYGGVVPVPVPAEAVLAKARRQLITALVITAAVAASAWTYALVSAIEYAGREPVVITVTECHTSAKKHSASSCDGTWTDPDGVARSGKVTDNPDHHPGEVVEGVSLGTRARIDPYGWIVDMVLGFPVAIGATAGFVWGVRVLRSA